MDLEALRSFYHVARERSFSAAARNLHISQPAMSVRIKALETELSERLFDRARKGVALTEAGAVLYESAERIFADVAEALARLRELRESGAGRVRAGCSDTFSLYTLPPVLARFRAAFPEAEIEIRHLHTNGILDLLLRGELDFGIVNQPVSLDRRLEARELFSDPLVVAGPRDDPLLARDDVALADLDGRAMVFLEHGTVSRETVDRALRAAKVRPRIVLETGSVEVQKLYAAAGFGLAFLPRSALVAGDEPRLVFRPLRDDPLRRRVVAVVPRGRFISRAATALLDMVEGSRP